jgi:arylformamidase
VSRVFDISLPVSPAMMTWPSDPAVRLVRTKTLARDGSNVSELRLGTHTGTHIDPPAHFIDGGGGIDTVPLDALVGPCVVADLTHVERDITAVEFEALPLDGVERLLCKTRNSRIWTDQHPSFPDEYVAITPDGARSLVERGIRLIGVDFLSVEHRGADEHPTHVTFLAAGVVIVEGLNLSSVLSGSYMLACLPINLVGGDGSPARAVLIDM